MIGLSTAQNSPGYNELFKGGKNMSFLDMLPKSNADRKQNANDQTITPPKSDKAEAPKPTEKDQSNHDEKG
jgi:hypothetical protein